MNIWISIAMSVILLFICSGTALGIAMAAKRNQSGAEPSGASLSGSFSCPSGNYSVVARSKATIDLINKNIDFFKEVADKTNVPWQAVASVSYRESNLDTSRSLSNGEAYCNNTDNTYSGPCNGKMDDAIGAMQHLKNKAPGNWNKDAIDAENIKLALFGYNGASDKYKAQAVKMGFPHEPGYDGSPYVMNNFDEQHRNMGIISHDHGDIDATDSRDGAFTVVSLLLNGEYDNSGKIVSLGGCKSNSLGSESACSAKILEIAQKEVGQIVTNECNKYSGSCLQWCAAFTSWVYKQAGYLRVVQPGTVALKENSNELEVVNVGNNITNIRPGDIFWKRAGTASGYHVGIVESIASDGIHTIEGNVGKEGNVDRVARRIQKLNEIVTVARPKVCK